MTSTRIFIVLIIVVLGVLLFKPKSKSIEEISAENSVSTDQSEKENADKIAALKTNDLANQSNKLNETDLAKNAATALATVSPTPTVEVKDTDENANSEEAETNAAANADIAKVNAARLKNAFKMPKSIKTTPEQQAKLKEVENKFTPKLEEQLNKMEGVLSDDQKRARNEAMVRSVFDGDRPDVKYGVIRNAMNLTGDQEQQLRDLNREFNKTRNAARKEMANQLTPEQKNSLPPNWAGGRRSNRN